MKHIKSFLVLCQLISSSYTEAYFKQKLTEDLKGKAVNLYAMLQSVAKNSQPLTHYLTSSSLNYSPKRILPSKGVQPALKIDNINCMRGKRRRGSSSGPRRDGALMKSHALPDTKKGAPRTLKGSGSTHSRSVQHSKLSRPCPTPLSIQSQPKSTPVTYKALSSTPHCTSNTPKNFTVQKLPGSTPKKVSTTRFTIRSVLFGGKKKSKK